MHAPECERVRGVAAAYVDHVLVGERAGRIVRPAEELDVGRAAATLSERLIEAKNLLCMLRNGGREKAHARAIRPRQIEHERLDLRVRVEQAAAPDRHDVPRHVAEYGIAGLWEDPQPVELLTKRSTGRPNAPLDALRRPRPRP